MGLRSNIRKLKLFLTTENGISKIIFVCLVLLLIYAIFRPEKIAPDFFSEIIPLRVLHVISLLVVVLPVVAFVFAAVNMRRMVMSGKFSKKNKNFWENIPDKSFISFMAAFLVVLLLSDMAKTGARNELKTTLEEFTSDISVRINGEIVDNPNELVSELKKVAPLNAHHSRTTKKFIFEIIGNDKNLVVELERDADNPEEYWVSYPKYRWRLYDEVGRIITNVFDDY